MELLLSNRLALWIAFACMKKENSLEPTQLPSRSLPSPALPLGSTLSTLEHGRREAARDFTAT